MSFDREMEAALIADGEKLQALTGEEHGPRVFSEWVANGKWQIVPHDNYMIVDMSDAEPPIQIVDGAGETVACNTSFYPTAITAEHAATIVAAVNEVSELRERLATARIDGEWLAHFIQVYSNHTPKVEHAHRIQDIAKRMVGGQP